MRPFLVIHQVALYAAYRIHQIPLEIISSKIARPQHVVYISDVHIVSVQLVMRARCEMINIALVTEENKRRMKQPQSNERPPEVVSARNLH